MNYRLPLLFVCLSSVAATCVPSDPPRNASEFRLDFPEGELDIIQSRDNQMCVSPSGAVYVVWVDDRDGSPDVWMNRKLAGDADRRSGWLEFPIKVNQGEDSNVFAPQIACTDQQVHVVWEDDRDGEVESHQIYYQRSNDLGSTFNDEDRLLENDEDGRTNSLGSQILVRDNRVFVVWYDDVNGSYDILVSTSPDGGNTWSDPERVDQDAPGAFWSAHPSITADSEGRNVYVTWEDFRQSEANPLGGSAIYFGRSTDSGNSWQNEALLSAEDAETTSAFSPQIAAANDDVYVVWHDNRNNTNDAFMSYSGDAGASWSAGSRANLDDPIGLNEALYPKVCVSNGTAHIVWHDNRELGFWRVFYNSAVAGNWTGGETRLDAYKDSGVPGVWQFDGGAESVQLDCLNDQVLVGWLDSEADTMGTNFNDVVYNHSTDNGETWLVGIREDASNHTVAPYRFDSIRPATSFKENLDVRILSDDSAYASWTDGRSGTRDIFFQQLQAGERPVILLADDEL